MIGHWTRAARRRVVGPRSLALSIALAVRVSLPVAHAADPRPPLQVAGADDLLDTGDLSAPTTPTETPTKTDDKLVESDVEKAHKQLFVESRFPSAAVCRTCHAEHYREWAMSQHSYAQLSPVLQAMQGLILKLTNGSNGDTCIRCHNPVGMNLGEALFTTSIDRHPASREGVTCVVCHRMSKPYGKVSGRLAIDEGSIFEPIHGPTGNAELKRVLANPDQYQVVTSADKQGRGIHSDVIHFPELSSPSFCGTCHDVTVGDGLRLEESFSEYQNSAAAARGITCQDCHMGKEPGVPSGYREEPAAVVGGVPTRPRKRTDHRFAGPDYSVIHPGIFPHNRKAQELATIREWLTFDYKAGWGKKDFERTVTKDTPFPPRWKSVDDRYDARAIIDENLKSLQEIAGERLKILQAGYKLEDVVVSPPSSDGIAFSVKVRNGTDGHNAPTGLDNERLVFLQVTVKDSLGKVVFRSGDTDPNGDLRDEHSMYVHGGDLPMDPYLVSLRSKFAVTMLHGGDREQVAPIPFSMDVLPIIRPEPRATILTGAPARLRKHKRGLPPLGERWAHYQVSAADLADSKPPYNANIKLIGGMVPINLLSIIQVVGFDYDMSPREVGQAVFAGYQTIWEKNVDLTAPAASLSSQ